MADAYKTVLLGQASVGKSCVVTRFAHGAFHDGQNPTIGAAYVSRVVNGARMDIWDTAGAERYRSLAPMYYRGAACAMLVYDVTDRASFQKARTWADELAEHASGLELFLVGNKKDLRAEGGVTEAEGAALAQTLGARFFETSAKTGENVQELFQAAAAALKTRPATSQNGIAVGETTRTSNCVC